MMPVWFQTKEINSLWVCPNTNEIFKSASFSSKLHHPVFIRDLSPTLTQLHIDNISWFTDDQERVRKLTGGRSIKVGPGSHLDPVMSSSVSHQYRSVAKNLRGLSRVKWIKSFLLRISAFSRNKFVILMINDDNDGTRASDERGAGKTKRRVDQVPRLQKTHWYLKW